MAESQIAEITMYAEGGVALVAVQDVPQEQRAQLVRNFLDKKDEATNLTIEDVANLIGYVTPTEEKSVEEKSAEGRSHGASIREFDDSIVIEVFAKAGIDISKLGYDQAYIIFSSMSPEQLRIAFRELVDKDLTTLLNFSNLLNRAVRNDLMSPETVKECKQQDKDNGFKMAEGRNATAMAIIRGVAAIMPNRYFDEGAIGYALLETIALKAVAAYGATARRGLGEIYESNFAGFEELLGVAPNFVENLNALVVTAVTNHVFFAKRNRLIKGEDEITERQVINLLKVFRTREGRPNYLWKALTKKRDDTDDYVYPRNKKLVEAAIKTYVGQCVKRAWIGEKFVFNPPFKLGDTDEEVLPEIALDLYAWRNSAIVDTIRTRFNDPDEVDSFMLLLNIMQAGTLEEAFEGVSNNEDFTEIPESILVRIATAITNTATAFSRLDRLCLIAQKFGVPRYEIEKAVLQFYELRLTQKHVEIGIPLNLEVYEHLKDVVDIRRLREHVTRTVAKMLANPSPLGIEGIIRATKTIEHLQKEDGAFLNELKNHKVGNSADEQFEFTDALELCIETMLHLEKTVRESKDVHLKAQYARVWAENALKLADATLSLIALGLLTYSPKGVGLVLGMVEAGNAYNS